jgi:hypothetical protein
MLTAYCIIRVYQKSQQIFYAHLQAISKRQVTYSRIAHSSSKPRTVTEIEYILYFEARYTINCACVQHELYAALCALIDTVKLRSQAAAVTAVARLQDHVLTQYSCLTGETLVYARICFHAYIN